MKVLMVAHTIDEEGTFSPGQLVELRDEIAKKYIEEGWAQPAPAEPPVERSTAGPTEQATGKAQSSRTGHPTPPKPPEPKEEK